jgi:hypothetical protein
MEEVKTKFCKKCQTELPLDEIHWSRCNRWVGGWQYACKVCSGGKYQPTVHPPPDVNNIRTCVKCGNLYPLTDQYFNKSKNSKAGFDRRCKKCKSKYGYQRAKLKRKTNLNFCIAQRCRESIHHALRKAHATKSDKTINLLGCSFDDYQKYIESKLTDGMTMELYRAREIEMDHNPPLAMYDLTDPEQQKQAFHYSRTSPMWKRPNSSKNSWYNGVRYFYDKSKMAK